MDLVHIWHNDRYRSKVYISNILPWPMGHKGKKLGLKVNLRKTMCTLQRAQFKYKTLPECFTVKSRPGSKLGHVRSKTRS